MNMPVRGGAGLWVEELGMMTKGSSIVRVVRLKEVKDRASLRLDPGHYIPRHRGRSAGRRIDQGGGDIHGCIPKKF